MSARAKIATRPDATRRYVEASASRLLVEILDRIKLDPTTRPLDYYRVSELIPPLSKPTIFRMLREGRLRGVKVGGCLLIEGASVRALVENAEPWRPTNDREVEA